MRILFIAPASDLDGLAELIAAVGENQPTVLSGIVTHREVLSTLRMAAYDIIHFAGHGTTMRLELSDGPLAVEMLISAMESQRQPQLIFLNSCRSLPAAAQLHRLGADYVIGWRDEVSDKVAVEFAVAFYNTLKLNANMSRAFGTARNILAEFHFDHESPILLNGRTQAMEQEIAALQKKIDADRIVIEWRWRLATLGVGALAAAALWLALVR